MTAGPYTAEFFKTALGTSHASARRIVPLVLALVPARSVLDAGCGTGHFLRAFEEAGVADIDGVDGDYVPRDQLVIGQDRFHPSDLAGAFDLGRRYDLVVSLEVAEHLPPASAETFVDALTRHGSVVLFSAAIPCQGGTAHLNEQWPSYWAEVFGRHGFLAYDAIRPAIWRDKEVAWWYRQNILLFADAKARDAHPALAALTPVRGPPLDQVHPENYAAKARGWQTAASSLQQLQTFLAAGSSFDVTRSADGQVRIEQTVASGGPRRNIGSDGAPAIGARNDAAGASLSIIVAARNSAADTSVSLASIRHSLAALRLKCELVLIDDASDPDEKLLDLFLQQRSSAPQHEFLIARSRRHQHYTGVFAIGLHLARGDNVVFISNDMMVTPSFLTALLAVSAASNDFGIVRGTSNYVDSHPEHTVAAPSGMRTYKDVEDFSRKMLELHGLAHSQDRELSGDAVLIKRSVIERIGVMDQRFFGYFGDIDFGLRAHNAGFKLVCAKGAWLFHKGAGHLKADKQGPDAAFVQRMAQVEKAYQAFREKWDMSLPGTYAELKSRDFLALAQRNLDRVPLKCELPATTLDDLEFH